VNMPMPLSLERRHTSLAESDKIASRQRSFANGKAFLLNGVHYERFWPQRQVFLNGEMQRLHARGKFLFVGGDKFGSVASPMEHSDRAQMVRSTIMLRSWRETYL